VGIPLGCESIIHSVRLLKDLWENHNGDEQYCIALLDIHNAFNSFDRSQALTICKKDFPSIYRWLFYCYNIDSHLFFGSYTIPSNDGAQQGDPLGPFLFSLTLHPIIKSLKDIISNLKLNAWYMDDGTIAGTFNDVNQAISYLKDSLPSISLSLNLNKSYIQCSGYRFPNNVQESIIPIENIKLANFEVLGSPVGSENYCNTRMTSKMDKFIHMFDCLTKLENSQVALALLRYTLSYGKLIFYMRTTPWSSIENNLNNMDLRVRQCFNEIFNTQFDELGFMQVRLPHCFGGFGIRSCTIHQPAAFLSSFYRCSPLILKICPILALESGSVDNIYDNITEDDEIDYSSCLWQAQVNSKWINIPEHIQTEIFAFNIMVDLSNTFHHSFPTEINQKKLSCFIDDKLYAQHMDRKKEKDDEEGGINHEVVRLLAQKNNKAVAWISAIPSPAYHYDFCNQDFIMLVHWWLNEDIYSREDNCPSCKTNKVDKKGRHSLLCKTSGDRIARHNALRDTIKELCQHAQLKPEIEKDGLMTGKKRPADVYIPSWTDGVPLALDIAVSHPFRASIVDKYNYNGYSAQMYDEDKRKQFNSKKGKDSINFHFLPLVVEIFGTWSEESMIFFSKLANRMAPNMDFSYSEAMHYIMQKLSVVLMRKNVIALRNRNIISNSMIPF
jgi:hypothetical protein